jgi:hypothetical protein
MTEVSRPEFDMLKDLVATGQNRMENIDIHGTRGVAVIQAQVTELIKDLTELKTTTESFQKSHDTEHKEEKRTRITGRRWLIGTAIAGTGVLGGIVGLLVEVLKAVGH